MGFMQPEIVEQYWVRVDGSNGVELVPCDVCGRLPVPGPHEAEEDYRRRCWAQVKEYFSSSAALDIEEVRGWGARLQAPGYLDSTEWQGPYDSYREALYAVCEDYDLCPECWECIYEAPQFDQCRPHHSE